MTASVTALLRCPVCGAAGEKTADGKSFFCHGERRHCYDFSKSGYLNFSRDGKTGDAKASVRARSAFLEAGYYALALIHISEPTRLLSMSYAVFCLKKKIASTKSAE